MSVRNPQKSSLYKIICFTLTGFFFLGAQELGFANVPPPPPIIEEEFPPKEGLDSLKEPNQDSFSAPFDSGSVKPVKTPVKKHKKKKTFTKKSKRKRAKKSHSRRRSKKYHHHRRKSPPKPTKARSWLQDYQKLVLFQWVSEQQTSFQWAYAFLKQTEKHAPDLLKEKIGDSFRNDMLFYLNFHQNIIQFPYILKWGLRASAGMTRNYNIDSAYFIPMSLSVITSLQIFEKQIVVPFFEMGYSFWSVDFSESSDFFPFWSVGADISFSIFKSSLRYTLSDEYGIEDIGMSLEIRNNSSPTDFPDEKRGYFLHSLHVGVYCKF